ncbi:hypothetical protein DIURU_005247 [Diutina rugosa]|uniref:Protein transport protein BOS1 n=1 Tax=Diutina rugosa TaxID=5481 RepID=A0A642UDR5_DIURU|nr:uncharacterized protein DIURU_005247 [Diutina rugosa]KAA8897270.1 hypothetical protein DIURU_005247 [Diutina rugosa]
MNSLYNHGLKQTQQLTKDLATFESNLSTSPLSLQGSISTTLISFRKTIKEYTDLVNNHSDAAAQEKHRARLVKFNQELQEYTDKFDSLRSQREEQIHESSKQELFGRRQASDNPYEPTDSASAFQQQQQQQQQQMSYQEGLYNERNSLSRGNQQLDHILEMGQQALEDIVGQNETLQKLQQKFEDGLVTLGVSQGTIRTIERRARQDKWLFWGCVVLMVILFYYLIKWFA